MAERQPDRMRQDGGSQDGASQDRGREVRGREEGGQDARPRVDVRGVDSFDDMHDSPEQLQCYASLARPLASCRRIEDEFNRADERAVAFRRAHRWMTHGAALSATVAVATAIVALSYYPIGFDTQPLAPKWLPSRHAMSLIELWSAGVAILVVIVGWISGFKEKWLLWRHQAESYRLLRYRFLIHPAVWREGAEGSRQWIETKLHEIDRTTLAGAVREAAPHGPFEGTQSRLPRAVLRALTEYYLARRLNPQKEYLANRTQRNEFSDWIRAYLPWFFFLSIVAVFCKFFVRNLPWEGFLALLAALLPAAAAGLRTWRSAFEFSRNKGRFEAAHHALRDLETRLVNEGFSAVEAERSAAPRPAGRRISVGENRGLTEVPFHEFRVGTEDQAPRSNDPAAQPDDEDIDAYAILRDLSWCEHILETEHREWLRLMYETEWFG
jgi:hypothetical protein